MKKKLIVIVALLMMLGLCDAGAYAFMPTYMDGAIPLEAGVSSAVLQSDIDNKFNGYADKSATRVYPEGENTSNVVGVVVDFSKNRLIRGAKIYLNGKYVVSTGQDGRFQIKNLPDGVYDWDVTAMGYKAAEYNNYTVHHDSGTNIFTLFVDKSVDIVLEQ